MQSPNQATHHGSELIVISTLSPREALRHLMPAYERDSGRTVRISYEAGSVLGKQLTKETVADLFIGPATLTSDLVECGVLDGTSTQCLARSVTALAIPAGEPKPDTGTLDQVRSFLVQVATFSLSHGPSGASFARLLESFGIADAVAAKFVMPQPGETVGEVIARGAAKAGVSQISELLPVAGIQILALPAQLQQEIPYFATAFCKSRYPAQVAELVADLRSEKYGPVWRENGLESFSAV